MSESDDPNGINALGQSLLSEYQVRALNAEKNLSYWQQLQIVTSDELDDTKRYLKEAEERALPFKWWVPQFVRRFLTD